jgi:hypothetical protein
MRTQASSSSKGFYQEFLNLLRTSYTPSKVKGLIPSTRLAGTLIHWIKKDGKFGAMMSINLCNEVLSTGLKCLYLLIHGYRDLLLSVWILESLPITGSSEIPCLKRVLAVYHLLNNMLSAKLSWGACHIDIIFRY